MKHISKIAWIAINQDNEIILFTNKPKKILLHDKIYYGGNQYCKDIENVYLRHLPKEFNIQICPSKKVIEGVIAHYSIICCMALPSLYKVKLELYNKISNINIEKALKNANLNSGFILRVYKEFDEDLINIKVYARQKITYRGYTFTIEGAKYLFGNNIINKIRENECYIIRCSIYKK